MFRFASCLAALVVLVGAGQVAAESVELTPSSVELVVNGGFELPLVDKEHVNWALYSPTSLPTIPGWTVIDGNVDITVEFREPWVAFEGAQFLDLNGLIPGAIQQIFTTTPGASYQVSFRYSTNPKANFPTSARMSVFDEGGQVERECHPWSVRGLRPLSR